MKNLVRALALSLVVTGTIASSLVNSASAEVKSAPRVSALPIPTCPPDDATGCGVCQLNGNCTQ